MLADDLLGPPQMPCTNRCADLLVIGSRFIQRKGQHLDHLPTQNLGRAALAQRQ